jgi:hypothetical protein
VAPVHEGRPGRPEAAIVPALLRQDGIVGLEPAELLGEELVGEVVAFATELLGPDARDHGPAG